MQKNHPATPAKARTARGLHSIDVDGSAKRHVIEELGLLMKEAQAGALVGLSYAATSNKRQNLVGVAGTHLDTDKAIASLFRAAVSLVMVE